MTDALTTAKEIGDGDFDQTIEAAIEFGMKTERDRIRRILTCPEAADREVAAAQIALAGCVSFEQARKILALSHAKPAPASAPSSALFH